MNKKEKRKGTSFTKKKKRKGTRKPEERNLVRKKPIEMPCKLRGNLPH